MSTLRFDVVTSQAQLERLREPWTALDDGRAPGAVFRSWEWQATWWRVLGNDPRRRRALHLVCGRDAEGRLRGLLPLYLEDAPVANVVPRRRVGLLGDDTVGSDYLGLIAPAAEQRLLAGEFSRALAADPLLRRADGLELNDLLVDDPLRDALIPDLRAAGYEAVHVTPRYRCPFAALSGGDLDGYLAARPDEFGRQTRARRKSLERQHGFRLEVRTTPDDVLEGLEALFALHRARWAADGGSAAITDDRVEQFHRAAGGLLAARGWARLALLHIDGAPVAAGYGFARAPRFAYYQAGLDPAWRRRSVGTVVLAELIARAFADGLEEFDFLRGEEPYKAIWATGVRHTCTVRARPPRLSARVGAAAQQMVVAARAVAHGVLPAPAVRLVRQWVRRRDDPGAAR